VDEMQTIKRGNLPLTLLQEILYSLEIRVPGCQNCSEAYRLRGPVNESALRASVAALVQRHDALRTVFQTTNALPRAAITQTSEVPIELRREINLELATHLVRQERLRGFDLSSALPFRVLLLELARDDHFLVVTFCHLVVDQVSVVLFMRELAHFYNALADGEVPSPLPRPMQSWEWLRREKSLAISKAFPAKAWFWTKKLSSMVMSPLPTDLEPGAEPIFHTDRQSITIQAGSLDLLKRSAREHGVTLFTVVLALCKIMLARFSGRWNVALFVPFHNRLRPQSTGVMGCLAMPLPLLVDFSPEMGFDNALKLVQAAMAEAIDNRDGLKLFQPSVAKSFMDFGNRKGPLPSHRTLPMVNYLVDAPRLELKGLAATSLELVRPDEFYKDLYFEFLQTLERDKLTLYVCYNPQLFKKATMSRLAEEFRCLSDESAAHPKASVRALAKQFFQR